MTVSIIMPAFDAGATIAEAVISVIHQDMPDWELIIAADDEDDYAGVLARHGYVDERVRFCRTRHVGSGPAAARNLALSLAGGDVVAPLDADDSWAPDRLSCLVPLAWRYGAAVDSVAVLDSSGQQINEGFSGEICERDITAKDILACGVPLHPIIRRDVIGDGWPDLAFAEDVVLNLEIVSNADAYRLYPWPLYHYRVWPGSICHRPGAWKTADAGYDRILEALRDGAFSLTPEVRALASEGFEQRKVTNLAFAEELKAGRARDFQEFLALHPSQS